MTETATCIRCEQTVDALAMRERCPRCAGGRRTHEVLNPPRWQVGDPRRPGSSLHSYWCERSNPSCFVDPPCTCEIRVDGIVGAAYAKRGAHAPEAQRHYDAARDVVRRVKNRSASEPS